MICTTYHIQLRKCFHNLHKLLNTGKILEHKVIIHPEEVFGGNL